MLRSALAVVGAAIVGLVTVTLVVFCFCTWLISIGFGRAFAWPLGAAAALIAAGWLLALWWFSNRLAEHLRWCREQDEAAHDQPTREHTVEIDGLRVRPRVMRLMMPHANWMKIRERAREQDADASR